MSAVMTRYRHAGGHRAAEYVSDRQVIAETGIAVGGLLGVTVLGAGVVTAPPGDRVLLGLFITCVVVLVWLLALVAGTVERWLSQQERARLEGAVAEVTALAERVERAAAVRRPRRESLLVEAERSMPRDWEGATREGVGR